MVQPKIDFTGFKLCSFTTLNLSSYRMPALHIDKLLMLKLYTVSYMGLVLFCRKGEVACCEEVKAFAIKHNIKQQQIAVLAGMSSVTIKCLFVFVNFILSSHFVAFLSIIRLH